MRAFIIMVWLMVPIGMGYHWFSPKGMVSRQNDVASKQWKVARATAQAALAAEGDQEVQRLLAEARSAYEETIKLLPKSKDNLMHRHQAALEKALVMIRQGEVVEALHEIEGLMEAIRAGQWPPGFEDDFRAAVAAGTYQVANEMRLRGYRREEWVPIADDARQQYALLADKHEAANTPHARALKENLEVAIRLVRMDLATFEGDPLSPPPSTTRMRRLGSSDEEAFIKSHSKPGH
jgi:hypothetical protein